MLLKRHHGAMFPHKVKQALTGSEEIRAMLADACARAQVHSPFLRRLIELYPDMLDALPDGLNTALKLADADPDLPVATRLRRARGRTMLAIALADLAGLAPFEQLLTALSDFADWALDRALESLIGDASGFAVLALGKHGSRELNYSSDIDPILIFDPDTLPRRAREEPGEAAVRIARRLVELLQTRDGDGFVFRVDLRLRPASEATPIAIPIDAAITHYESSALAWERAAFIRARAAAGDKALGTKFLNAVEPFVWRRSLDYGAVDALQALTRSIRDHHGAAALGPGYDVKRGRGGIREIEFYAQIHQLIHGGRDPALRVGNTLAALAALADAEWLAPPIADRLAEAYVTLRTIEHRLQLIDDRQTHSLPTGADLDAVAGLHGLADGAALIAPLADPVAFVAKTYDALDNDHSATPRAPSTDASLEAHCAAHGFADPVAARQRIVRWRSGGVRAVRSPAAIAAFEAVLPHLLAALGSAAKPDAALARFDQLLGRLSSGINLFRLLDAQPPLRALLVAILSHAPPLADALAQTPALLDRLVDRTALGPVPPLDALIATLRGPEGLATEALLDRVRQQVGEHRFALGTQIIEGASDPIDVAAGYARLAESAVVTLVARTVADFAAVHGRVADSDFVVVALGRLGGGRLTHASDLDLVYLFTGEHNASSDGARPLGATHYYNRLGQRVSAALSVATSAGPLYVVDTRLRPSGAQGPLVVSLDSFVRYQREAAWTWEHMALARARSIAGLPAAQRRVDAAIANVLAVRRPTQALARDIVAMRADIARHKPPTGAFDIKLGVGGLVDLEFALHFNQLASGIGLTPDLRAAIAQLSAAGRIAPALSGANDLLTRLLVTLRLVAPDMATPTLASRAIVARACLADDWGDLLAQLADARQLVTAAWHDVVARTGDPRS